METKIYRDFSNVKIALISKSPPDIDVVAGLPTDSASPEQSSKPAISTPENLQAKDCQKTPSQTYLPTTQA